MGELAETLAIGLKTVHIYLICTYIYTYTRIQLYMYVYMYTYTYIYTYTYTLYIYIYIYVYIHIYIYVHVCIYKYIHVGPWEKWPKRWQLASRQFQPKEKWGKVLQVEMRLNFCLKLNLQHVF